MNEARPVGTGTPDLRYELVYKEALRALASQEEGVEALRNRAGLLLAAASVSHSFLGGIAINAVGLNGWAWAALLFFALIGGCAVAILWPTGGWLFSMDVNDLLADYVYGEDPADIDEMRRELAQHLQTAFRENKEKMALLYLLVRIGAVLLVLGALAWFADLAWG